MARPWEYARWRRVVMQVVLCAALGATTALAYWLGHVHAEALRVNLGAPRTFSNPAINIQLRLPADWKLEAATQNNEAQVAATEDMLRYGSFRTLELDIVRLEAAGTSPTPEQVISADMGSRQPIKVSEMDFLGHRGVLAEYPAETVDAAIGKTARSDLYACTVIPGPRPVVVTVRMTGPLTFAPADIDLLKNVAQSIQPADPAHPAPDLAIPSLKLHGFNGPSPTLVPMPNKIDEDP